MTWFGVVGVISGLLNILAAERPICLVGAILVFGRLMGSMQGTCVEDYDSGVSITPMNVIPVFRGEAEAGGEVIYHAAKRPESRF